MVDRIRTLLASRQLSPTQFADAIGVARPIVSHILSGRNKPSLEVVQRILSAMPDLSMPWLLNGTGAMLAVVLPAAALPAASAQAPPVAPESSEPAVSVDALGEAAAAARNGSSPVRLTRKVVVPSLAAQPPSPQQRATVLGQPRRFANKRVLAASSPPMRAGGTVDRAEPLAAPEVAANAPKETTEHPAPPLLPSPMPVHGMLGGGEKAVRRIVVFYRDGSFTDYRPE